MQAIPETGGGLSGFLANALWHLYRYFPSSGRWDWLLLFFLMALLSHVLFLPHLWRSIKVEMAYLKAQQTTKMEGDQVNFYLLFQLLSTSSMLFGAWHLYTDAGRTLLEGRKLFWMVDLSGVNMGLFWSSLGICIAVASLLLTLSVIIDRRKAAISPPGPQASADRSPMNLYGGGGIFVYARNGDTFIETGCGVIWPEACLLVLLHIFYWRWSVASLMLFLMFLGTGLLVEVIRMMFVYVLHKRTFGSAL